LCWRKLDARYVSRPPHARLTLDLSLNSVLDVTNGILYIAIAVVDPSKPETIVVTVLQDATGMEVWAELRDHLVTRPLC
jgi:hypothetical protein